MHATPSPSPRRAAAVATAALAVLAVATLTAAGHSAPAVAVARAAAPAPPATAPAVPAHDHADHDSGVSAHAAPARPVAAPAAVSDVQAAQEAAGLSCDTTASGVLLCGHGDDAPPPPVAGPVEVLGGEAPLPCHGDGQSGPRVRTVYARPEGAPDRFAAAAASFRRWASAVDRDIAASAARTGGTRHVRLATTPGPDCALSVARVTLPAAAFSSFTATVDALHARGFSRPDAKYLVWADADVYCGVATMYADDSPGQGNLNNGGAAAYARVDRRCWGAVETHEVVHMLGGAQRSAPNSTAGYHCRDGHDVLCYDDGSPDGAQRTVCAASAARLLDCGNDDYFSTAPAAGSYLATHWNTARSAFLSAVAHEARPAATPSPAPSTRPSTRPSPSPSPSPSGLVDGLLDLVPTVAR